MKKALSVALAAALVVSLAACESSSSAPAPAPAPVPEVAEKSQEPVPEPEPEPVVEWIPFDSITYSGTGDSVIEIAPPDDRAWMLEISGNSSTRHFAVEGYDKNMNSTELFVNTTRAYEGFVIDPSLSTVLLEVSAVGDWAITVHDLYATVPSISKGQTVSGFGDAIYEIVSYGTTAKIEGNSDARHFSVETFGEKYDELLVNTVDPYAGSVMLKGDPFLMIINSDSDWSITF